MGQSLLLFSPRAIAEKSNRALLIQFVLAELIEAQKAYFNGQKWEVILSHPARLFPYDWNARAGFLNKVWEHGQFLRKSFPDQLKAVASFEKNLMKIFYVWRNRKTVSKREFQAALKRIYKTLELLIERCKEDENLLFFLLKNRIWIDTWTHPGNLRLFLEKIHAEKLEILGEKMCDQYHQRGFFSQIPEFKLLLTELSHV